METLETLARRLDSLGDLRAIVRTMKSLAAVSIRQYERAVEALRGYYTTVETGIQVVLRDTRDADTSGPRQGPKVGRVIFGSDHGLCGRFNEELVEDVGSRLGDNRIAATGGRWLCVGARPAALLEAAGHTPDAVLETPASAARIGTTVDQILEWLDRWQQSAAVGRVELFYQLPESTTRHHPAHRVLLPVERAHFPRFNTRHWPGRSYPVYTMERAALFRALVRQYLFVSLFRACAESLAAENGSRLAAMQAAESSIDDRLEEITMTYRRARQESITTELLDVVTGFEVLSGRGSQ